MHSNYIYESIFTGENMHSSFVCESIFHWPKSHSCQNEV